MREVPLSGKAGAGMVALVDDQDYELVSQHTWHVARSRRKTSYAATRLQRVFVYMHRLILGEAAGSVTDHRNGNGLDNRRCNLRPASTSQNVANAGFRNNKRSRFKGVWPQKRGDRWQAVITLNRKRIYLGAFPSQEAAASAYDLAAFHLFGEFANFNFPEKAAEYAATPWALLQKKEPRGCYFKKNRNAWIAKLVIGGRAVLEKYCKTEEEARAAYLAAKEKFHVAVQP